MSRIDKSDTGCYHKNVPQNFKETEDQPMSARLVSVIDTKNLGDSSYNKTSESNLHFGDINGDGIPEILVPQHYPMNREMCTVTAMDLNGNILWQHGDPKNGSNNSYCDIPLSVFDWDGDGLNEVLYVRQAKYKIADMWRYSTASREVAPVEDYNELRNSPDLACERAEEYEGDAYLVVLDGATGAVKKTYPIPAPADDCLAFGYFDGTGKPNVLVKDRYWNMWALNNDAEILWHVTAQDLGEGFCIGLGHQPAVGDIDGDGLDEVFITNTLFDSDGAVLWRIDGVIGHSDASAILDMLPEKRIIAAGDKTRCISADGRVLWEYDAGHQQNVVPGDFSRNPAHGPRQFLSRDAQPWASTFMEGIEGIHSREVPEGYELVLYDWDGNILWKMNGPVAGVYRTVRWNGIHDSIVQTGHRDDETGSVPVTIMDAEQNVIDVLHCVDTEGKPVSGKVCVYTVDLLGDSRDEIVLFNGDIINIYANTAPFNQRRHYNFTHYNGE